MSLIFVPQSPKSMCSLKVNRFVKKNFAVQFPKKEKTAPIDGKYSIGVLAGLSRGSHYPLGCPWTTLLQRSIQPSMNLWLCSMIIRVKNTRARSAQRATRTRQHFTNTSERSTHTKSSCAEHVAPIIFTRARASKGIENAIIV